MQGCSLLTYLLPESIKVINSLPDNEITRQKILFQDHEKSVIPLEGVVFFLPPSWVIIGEKPVPTNTDVLKKMTSLQNEMVNLTREMQRKNRELSYANATIKTLRGIIPICSFCKGIRDDEGYWKRLEEYMVEMTEAEFSHSICPKCMEEQYPEMVLDP